MTNDQSSTNKRVGRRGFLKGAAAGAAGTTALVTGIDKSLAQEQGSGPRNGSVPPPTAQQVARDSANVQPKPEMVRGVQRAGSDLMIQVLKDLGIEYVAGNPGSSYEGLQESVINYGEPPNKMPEFITALHEESAVDMANGYGKAEGKPMCAMLHGTIGLQHASMAIYQAFYSGTPMLMLAGRDEGFIQAHTAHDMAGYVRSITKWDAQPTSLEGTLSAIQEAYRQAITPPTAPTLVVVDMEFQKAEGINTKIPAYRPPTIPGVDTSTAKEIAKGLLAANNPRINVGNFRTPEGVKLAVNLAELTGACTSTAATQGPMSFPQRHPLCGPGADTQYDYVLGLESNGANITLQRAGVRELTASRDVAKIGWGGLEINGAENPGGGRGKGKGKAPAVQGRRLMIDAEASLPAIIAEVTSQVTPDQKRRIDERKTKHADANHKAYVAALEKALETKKKGWDASPVSTARIYAELWPLIENEDWCFASPSNFSGSHNNQLWSHNKPYSYLGGQGAGGMGYGAGACTGAALAAKARNRFVVNIQTDGDMNYAPGSLWTAAHHQLPMLTVMHNNRAWHQELMFMEYVAGSRNRGGNRASIGTTLRDPYISYAKMAEAYGMAGEGPIEDPKKLEAALRRGVASVKRGAPYMIDVVTQPR